jgi:hypothetical protein
VSYARQTDLVQSLARLERMRKHAAERGRRAGYAKDQSRLIRLAHFVTAIERHENNLVSALVEPFNEFD